MNSTEREKLNRNIDLINFALLILMLIPFFFASKFVENSFQTSELLTQQIKNFDELKLLYFDLKNSKINSSIQIEQNVDTLKLNRLRQIEYNQQFIKIKHDSISTANDLIKMILSFIIALPLVKILNKSKNQLKRSVSGSSDVNYKDK